MTVKNSKGKIWYGMHFYPGVAEYREAGKNPSRVFLNEGTLRLMDPTFAGRPVYVDHVDGVEDKIDDVRENADGFVIESFFNSADGKHWVKFITVTDKADRAIQRGYRLSNAYFQKNSSRGGTWNGVSFDKEITDGEYEHLAIVNNPRYNESVIMTPEQFKEYNAEQEAELIRLANSNDEKEETTTMGLSIFKRTKVENKDVDFDTMSVKLPTSKKEMTLKELVEDHDKHVVLNGFASEEMLVKVGKEEMTVKDLVAKLASTQNELAEATAESEEEVLENDDDMDMDEDMDNEEDEDREEEIDDAKKMKMKKNKKKKNKKKNEADESEEGEDDAEAVKNAQEEKERKAAHFKKLKNAREDANDAETVSIVLSEDRVARGKSRYGS